jgi:N-acetylglucosaminyldiphosphoundecaprenol N-acetyl-beta-D-mannosaminyltransferase
MDQLILDHLASPSTPIASTPGELHVAVGRRNPLRIQTVNLHHLVLAHSSTSFRRALLDADLLTADGWPVVRAMRALGRDVDRVTGSTFTEELASPSAHSAVRRVGLLGASAEAGDLFAERLAAAGRALVFREHGRYADWDAADLRTRIESARPDLLLVAVTPPDGDTVAAELVRLGLEIPVIAVGGAVDMVCGLTRRAPDWVAAAGVEWLYRFAQEPRRLFRRYFVGCTSTFVAQVLVVVLGLQRPTNCPPALGGT